MCTGLFYFMGATINPILYNILAKNFRKAFMQTVFSSSSSSAGSTEALTCQISSITKLVST